MLNYLGLRSELHVGSHGQPYLPPSQLHVCTSVKEEKEESSISLFM